MSQKGDIDYRLFIPFLIHSVLVQVITALTRVTTSYRAIELDLALSWYGAISSGYALLPIFLAIPIGRWMDRGNDARAIWAGSVITFTAAFLFWLTPDTPWRLLAFTAMGGVGHLFLMAGHQMFALRCSGPVSRETVLGNYMVALAIGQTIGPFAISWLAGGALHPPTGALFTLSLAVATAALAVSFAIPPAPAAGVGEKKGGGAPIMDLLRVRGLVAVIVASVMTVSAMDLIIIYLPLLGAEREIGATHVGLLLMTRAVASMASRLFYARAMRLLGRVRLTLVSMVGGALGFVALGVPLPLPLMYLAMAVMGLGLGLAIVLCLSNVVDLAPPESRGAAMTMRLTGNRIGQFGIPFVAGFLGAAAGVGAILALTALGLASSGYAVHRAYRRR